MAEKASLLSKLPPVVRSNETEQSVEAQPIAQNSSDSNNLLSIPPAGASGAADVTIDEELTTVVTTEAAVAESASITPLQLGTYASFVLAFCLAGFAAVILFKKVSQVLVTRYLASFKGLGVAFVFVALHGFFATYLYTNALKTVGSAVPLAFTVGAWLFLGPTVGFVANKIYTRNTKLNAATILDLAAYVFAAGLLIFALAPSSSAGMNLLLSGCALGLILVPVGKYYSGIKKAQVVHEDLKDARVSPLLHSLCVVPLFLPVVAVLDGLGLSADLVQLSLNALVLVFVGAVFWTVRALVQIPASEVKEVAVAANDCASGSMPEPKSKVEVVATSDVVEFKSSPKPKAPVKTGSKVPPAKPLPPRKLSDDSSAPKAPLSPKKSDTSQDSDAPNAPRSIKAPSKPKKRF